MTITKALNTSYRAMFVLGISLTANKGGYGSEGGGGRYDDLFEGVIIVWGGQDKGQGLDKGYQETN